MGAAHADQLACTMRSCRTHRRTDLIQAPIVLLAKAHRRLTGRVECTAMKNSRRVMNAWAAPIHSLDQIGYSDRASPLLPPGRIEGSAHFGSPQFFSHDFAFSIATLRAVSGLR
jgi:hypothetical protein